MLATRPDPTHGRWPHTARIDADNGPVGDQAIIDRTSRSIGFRFYKSIRNCRPSGPRVARL